MRISYVGQSSSFIGSQSVFAVLKEAGERLGIPSDELDGEIRVLMGRAGFDDPATKVANLSGGWRKRLEVICGLVGNPDLVFFDEPTNHLDFDGIWWLEQLLSNARFAWVAVSHDRAFLDNVAVRILEVNRQYPGGSFVADGNYSAFSAAREQYFDAQARREESLANKARRETEWLRQGVKARTTKARFRIEAAESLQQELGQLRKRLGSDQANLEFAESGRRSKKLVSLAHVDKSLGDRSIVTDVTYEIQGGARIGILGGNGTGKSTLLKLIAKELEPTQGKVDHVQGLTIVYFDQFRQKLPPEWTLRRCLCESGDHVIFNDRPIHIVTWARRFQFSQDHLDQPIAKLSGGERAKANIAKLMLEKADLLLLDEPTNDLDIDTMEALEDALSDFGGAVAIVSHDRFMLQSICTTFLGLDGTGAIRTFASIGQWESLLRGGQNKKREKKAELEPSIQPMELKKLSYKDQREYDGMEERILKAEEELEEMRLKADDPSVATNAKALHDALADLHRCQESLDALYARWAHLEALVRPQKE
jgi:ATP-binding cassette subfamily F protein uup